MFGWEFSETNKDIYVKDKRMVNVPCKLLCLVASHTCRKMSSSL